MNPPLLRFNENGPVATIAVETFEGESEPSIVMTWVTQTLPGHDENGARGPYTHRSRGDITADPLSIFVQVANMLGTAAANGVWPKIDSSVVALLKGFL